MQDAKASLKGAVQRKSKIGSSQCSASRALLPQAHKNGLDYQLGGFSSPVLGSPADWPPVSPGSG